MLEKYFRNHLNLEIKGENNFTWNYLVVRQSLITCIEFSSQANRVMIINTLSQRALGSLMAVSGQGFGFTFQSLVGIILKQNLQIRS